MPESQHIIEEESEKKVRGPLSFPAFRMLWLALAISGFGTLIQNVGAAWLMASITTNPTWTTLVQASTTLPIMMFSIVAGALADNYERRNIMLVDRKSTRLNSSHVKISYA